MKMAEKITELDKESTEADIGQNVTKCPSEDYAKSETKENSVLSNDDDREKKVECAKSKEDLPDSFVYEPTSGLYYDRKTGYYYNAEYGLYYDGNTGCYYSLNRDTNEFELYSEQQNLEKAETFCKENNEANEQGVTDKQIEANSTSGSEDDDREIGELLDTSDHKAAVMEEKYKKDTVSFINEIREAAESAQISSGFIYEPTSGLFYDQKSGYYYNAECGLYYDGNTGSYYRLNQNTDEFELYSEGRIPDECKNKIKKYPQKRKLIDKKEANNDKEEGEISSSCDEFDNEEEEEEDNNNDNHIKRAIYNSDEEMEYEDISENYPPSLRLIVQETNLSNLRIGTLFIITFKGGTLGREGNDHDATIPDSNVSKYHLKFMYNDKEKIYQCIDLGSRNGTILNGKRMSSAKQESEPYNVEHGSIIQISQTRLLCHVHNGSRTCNDCEPGCVMEKSNSNVIQTISHKDQLKLLKKRYGLNVKGKTGSTNDNNQYKDRAEARRKEIGSTNEYEKTQMASTETEISEDNKGFKLLEKMGWKKGETLSTNAPINPISNVGTTGLGFITDNAPILSGGDVHSKQNKKWKIAQQRFKNLSEFLPSSNK